MWNLCAKTWEVGKDRGRGHRRSVKVSLNMRSEMKRPSSLISDITRFPQVIIQLTTTILPFVIFNHTRLVLLFTQVSVLYSIKCEFQMFSYLIHSHHARSNWSSLLFVFGVDRDLDISTTNTPGRCCDTLALSHCMAKGVQRQLTSIVYGICCEDVVQKLLNTNWLLENTPCTTGTWNVRNDSLSLNSFHMWIYVTYSRYNFMPIPGDITMTNSVTVSYWNIYSMQWGRIWRWIYAHIGRYRTSHHSHQFATLLQSHNFILIPRDIYYDQFSDC